MDRHDARHGKVRESRPEPANRRTTWSRDADAVITMGCGDAGPVYPGKRYLDWDLPDPAGEGSFPPPARR
jgi:arsenate reductase